MKDKYDKIFEWAEYSPDLLKAAKQGWEDYDSGRTIPMVNTLDEYQKAAMVTASNMTLSHVCHGLVAEAGELNGVLQKAIYKGKEPDCEDFLSELGDVLWYCALAAENLDMSLPEVTGHNLFTEIAAHTVEDLNRATLDIAKYAAEYSYKPAERRYIISDIIICCARIAAFLDTSLQEVARDNIFKLRKRHEGY